MNPLTTALLRVLRELDESRLRGGYVIIRPEPGAEASADYPLDLAVYAWRDAGCPDVEDDPGGNLVIREVRCTHRVATKHGHREVLTKHRAGIFAVHLEQDGIWAVTHLPSGWRVGGLPSLDEAIAHADHMHATAGNVGVDCTFGEQPRRAVCDALRNAGMKNAALVRA